MILTEKIDNKIKELREEIDTLEKERDRLIHGYAIGDLVVPKDPSKGVRCWARYYGHSPQTYTLRHIEGGKPPIFKIKDITGYQYIDKSCIVVTSFEYTTPTVRYMNKEDLEPAK